ncbi:UNVERIFIED_CONTAM: hypothetical protein Sangu_2812200 [Sesamum angustifolium]|uniref:GAG-pre-integrase domain-containing protein n=1 Tax=Sesamum angustifolium TaxID=2727405 RepID=A0AAW2IRN6_9LAMI
MLEDLKVGLDNDTYIEVILQSLLPSYDLFIINYNIKGLEKSTHELINMLVQYEATTHKYTQAAFVGEASTSKVKGKRARRWKRKKGKERPPQLLLELRVLLLPLLERAKVKERLDVLSGRRQMMSACIAKKRGIGKRECPQLLSNLGMLVIEVNMITNVASWVLDTGCGGHICNNLQLNLIMTAQHKRKSDNHEDAQLWRARLGYISKDRIRKLVDSKSLEIDYLDNLPTCESCLKGKMTTKPFVGQNTLANGLLDLIHIDVCGPLNTSARGGYSYFITFTDDHSWYDYVYVMTYKSKAFGKFKEYQLEVENQTSHKIKALRSDRDEVVNSWIT